MGTGARCAGWGRTWPALSLMILVGACGFGDGRDDGRSDGAVQAMTAIDGLVLDGPIADARVCLDLDRSGRCDGQDPQAQTDALGRYTLSVPADSTAPLIAEVLAGRSRDLGAGGALARVSYRMASPSVAYSKHITPLTTMVLLEGVPNLAVAEDIARADLGLPPRFDLRPAAPPPAGTPAGAVSRAVREALEARSERLELNDPGAKAALVAAFPQAIAALPRLVIETRNSAPITSKEVYVDAVFRLSRLAQPDQVDVVNGRIRGRGNSTWGQPKNPYKVQFSNDASYARVADVLGMPRNRNWALLADYFDRSLLRNQVALSLGNSSAFRDGLKWTPSGQHVEVWLNGDYVGVYLLTEDIRIDPARLAIRRMSTDPAAGEVDGGYIAEVDQRLDCYAGDVLDLQLVTPQAVPICIDTPDETAITPQQLAWIKAELLRVEADLYGLRRLDGLNLPSFADWYLVQELLRNNDALFVSSDFLWKDSARAADPADRLVNMGPLWDFDRAAGNVNYNDNWMVDGCWVSKDYLPNWFAALFQSPQFVELTLSRWHAKRQAIGSYLTGALAAYSRRVGPAARRNFERWPVLGVPLTNYYTFTTHEQEVQYLSDFLMHRLTWLDMAYRDAHSFRAFCQ